MRVHEMTAPHLDAERIAAYGRLVYFRADRGVALYTIPAEGGALREIVHFDDPTKTVWPYFSLGSDKVYFSVKEIDSDIYVMDLEMK